MVPTQFNLGMDAPSRRGLMRHSGWFSKKKPKVLQPLRYAHPESDTAVGEGTFGKAYVNCALRGNKSKWGKLRDKDAAVFQLLIDPRQDAGYKLRELVLELSFAESDPRDPTSPTTGEVTTAPTEVAPAPKEPCLLILEPPSPKDLRGKTATQHVSHEVLLQPHLGARGVSFGGAGPKKTHDNDIERAWRFQSHWANNELGLYTNAQWNWKTFSENPDIDDVGALYAGLILQHPGQPFYLTCKVSGKLVSLGKKFRYGNDGNRPYHTLIHPRPSQQNLQNDVDQLEDTIIELMSKPPARILISQADEATTPQPAASKETAPEEIIAQSSLSQSSTSQPAIFQRSTPQPTPRTATPRPSPLPPQPTSNTLPPRDEIGGTSWA